MNDKITCPNCGHSFDVEEALSGKLEEHYKAEYEKKVADQVEKFKQQKQTLDKEKEEIARQREQQEDLINQELKIKLEKEKEKIKKAAVEDYEEELEALRSENTKQKEQNKALRKKELEIEKLRVNLKDKEEDLELQVEKRVFEQRKSLEAELKKKAQEGFELERKQLQKQIEDSRKLAEVMKRKAESGSQQMQGEIQELALEELLGRLYPFDKIEEVPKGIRGADCIQYVTNQNQQKCGSIVYESKRTKHFSDEWIEKLKQDQVNCKADVAVLVTQAMPADLDKFGERNGVWVCQYNEVKGLSYILREMLVRIGSVKSSQENKGQKMELLYNYMTSPEFSQNIKRIVENYNSMIDQLNKEKRAMHQNWAKREKQIWSVQENIAALFGSIEGIAGKELDSGDMFKLPE